jgi:hypothetical protein
VAGMNAQGSVLSAKATPSAVLTSSGSLVAIALIRSRMARG